MAGLTMSVESLRRLRFTGPFAKLDRAGEHMRELGQLLDAHMRRPDLVVGTIGYEPDAHKIYPRYRVQGVPPKALVVAGDVIHNLRSALDQVMWQLVLANGGQPSRATTFPIYRQRQAVTIAGGVSPTTQRLVEAVQPFNAAPWVQTTTLPLAMLQHISNMDKHRMLIRGRHGLQQLMMTAGAHRAHGGRWEGRIVLGDVDERGRAVTLEPLRGSPGEVGGSAWYQVDVEYAPTPVGSEAPYNFADLWPTLTEVARYTRTLVGRLVATVWPDWVAVAETDQQHANPGATVSR